MQPALLEELSVTLVAVRCEYRMYVYCASPFPAWSQDVRFLNPPPLLLQSRKTPRACRRAPCLVATRPMMHAMAVLGLAPSGPLHHAVAFEGATLAAVGAARRITEPHEAQFRHDRAVVLRGIHSCELDPLEKLGDPQPWEMDGVDAEMRIAAALVSRLLGAAFLRDPCGSWCSMLQVPSWWRHSGPGRPGRWA